MLHVEERAIAGNPELVWQCALGEFLPKQTKAVCVKLGHLSLRLGMYMVSYPRTQALGGPSVRLRHDIILMLPRPSVSLNH